MEQNSAQIFSENWSIYQKIMSHNYMHHAEFAEETAGVFNSLIRKNLHLLDVGCGDVIGLLPALQKASIGFYTGYDLSLYALQVAATRLSSQNFSFALKEGNMMPLIAEEEKQFDVIYSSFAIHHLQDDEKRKLFQICFDKLLPRSKMIYIDVFRQENITREQYIQEYFSYIKNDWLLLTADEKQPIYEHVSQYDFPSDIVETIGWLKQTGFSVYQNYQTDHRHVMLVLNKE
jgi:ubiquinone/menaquinone biosynthesis C-methylase UbiE